LAALVMQCLEKDPDNRPLSAREVADRLARIGERLVAQGAGLAAVVPSAAAAAASPDEDTVVIPAVAAAAAGPWSGPPAASLPVAAVGATVAGDPELGVAPGRPAYERDDHRERSSPWSTVGFVVIALILLALAAVAAFAFLGSRGGGVADATATPTSRFTPTLRATPSSAIVVPPVGTPLPELPTPTPEFISPEPVTPEPPVITPEPPVVTPEPPVVTPQPPVITPQPPVVTPGPPAPQTVRVRIPDESFSGDFPDETTYHGRSASWVYGQGTPYNSMTASFATPGVDPSGPATLQLVGLDGENELKNATRIAINGVTIYEGPNPLPNDFGTGGPGNWGTVTFSIPAGVLGTSNTLTVTNLEDNDCTNCPKYVMIDRAVVDYTAL
ncbi:MAG TPA: hypothetical protein VMZ33_06800, partial [Candidatus Limnocylindrales bacterium]|nr:hypothetical protein [Candidatus Limnocylindrales bacterium]